MINVRLRCSVSAHACFLSCTTTEEVVSRRDEFVRIALANLYDVHYYECSGDKKGFTGRKTYMLVGPVLTNRTIAYIVTAL